MQSDYTDDRLDRQLSLRLTFILGTSLDPRNQTEISPSDHIPQG